MPLAECSIGNNHSDQCQMSLFNAILDQNIEFENDDVQFTFLRQCQKQKRL